MSDLGLLSREYQLLLDLTKHLKEWVGVLKRVHLNLPIPEDLRHIQPSEATKQLELVIQFLYDVIAQETSAWPEVWIAAMPLPVNTVQRLHEIHASDLPQYREYLGALGEDLKDGVNSISDKDIALLDEVVAAAGANTNAVFRRLMRWR